jgi:hypothetical protein
MFPSIPLSYIPFSTPIFIENVDTVSKQELIPPDGVSRMQEANKKESQARWGSDLALHLPRRPHPMFEGDPIVKKHRDLGVCR